MEPREDLPADGTPAASPELAAQEEAPNPWYATTIPTAGIQSRASLPKFGRGICRSDLAMLLCREAASSILFYIKHIFVQTSKG